MAGKRKYTDEQIVAALKECKGMIYLAADRVGCHADTIYARAKQSAAIRKCMRAERGRVIDTSELKLYQAIMNGEPWAIQMALKTIGKDRGYVEQKNVEVLLRQLAGQFSQLSDDELIRIASESAAADAGEDGEGGD